jgi:hypothetical protein
MSEAEGYALVPLPGPGPAREALLREAIAFGGSDELLRKFFDCEAVERELTEQQAQLGEFTNRMVDVGAHLMDQVEEFTVRQDKQRRLDAKRKADQERQAAEEAARAEAEEIETYLAEHPEPGAATAESEANGELHAIDPKERENEADAGGVALSYPPVPSSYVRGEQAEDPEEPGIGGASDPEPDLAALGKPKAAKQVSPATTAFW